MGGINLSAGQFNIASFLSVIAVAAVLWFGNLVTGDHEKISGIAGGVQNIQTSVAGMQAQVSTLQGQVTAFQGDLAEMRARLDCAQGVGTVAGCERKRRMAPTQ